MNNLSIKRMLIRDAIFVLNTILLISPFHSESAEISISGLNNTCIAQYCCDVEKRRGFEPAATGGRFWSELRGPVLALYSSYQITLPEARALIMEEIYCLLSYFNRNLKARPYMHEYPLNASDLDYTIRFKNSKIVVDPELIARVVAVDGKIIYFKRDPSGNGYLNRNRRRSHRKAKEQRSMKTAYWKRTRC